MEAGERPPRGPGQGGQLAWAWVQTERGGMRAGLETGESGNQQARVGSPGGGDRLGVRELLCVLCSLQPTLCQLWALAAQNSRLSLSDPGTVLSSC